MTNNDNPIRKRRLAMGLTLWEASTRAGLTTITTWQRAESGKNIKVATLVKIAKALECEPGELINQA